MNDDSVGHDFIDLEQIRRIVYTERYAWLALFHDPAMVISLDGHIEDVNTQWERVTGWNQETLSEGYILEYMHFEDRERALGQLQKLVTSDLGSASLHFRFLCRDDTHVLLNWNVVFSPEHESYFCVAREARMNDRRRATNPVYRDVLTNLPNRLALSQDLDEALARVGGCVSRISLCFIDLDGFKSVNDTLGHRAGDALLVRVARSMESAVEPPVRVYRMGGDEFIILNPECGGRELAGKLAQSILWCLSGVQKIDGNEVKTGASIGIAFVPDDANTSDDLIEKADQAMYVAKRTGKNRYVFADEMPEE